MQELEGRVAVITGAGSGIGEALAHACAAANMRVVVSDIEEKQAERVAGAVRLAGGEARAVRTDVSKREDVDQLAEFAYDTFGAVHLLCNNAGVLVLGPLQSASQADWDWVMSVNVYGLIHGIAVFLPRLSAQGGEAHIVNTASIAGVCVLAPGMGVYTASKYAVVAISETLRAELESAGIGVSVLCPGGVDTGIFNSARNRPAALGGATAFGSAADPESLGDGAPPLALAPPKVIAERVIEAVKSNRLYIFTHPEMRPAVERRCSNMLAAFGAAG